MHRVAISNGNGDVVDNVYAVYTQNNSRKPIHKSIYKRCARGQRARMVRVGQ